MLFRSLSPFGASWSANWVIQEAPKGESFADIDAAYRSKYRHHPATYVNMMVSFEARSTTARLTPRLASS